jgi:hypothetical protein|eukprot:10205861-Prorocentrum_lima.AAC.1
MSTHYQQLDLGAFSMPATNYTKLYEIARNLTMQPKEMERFLQGNCPKKRRKADVNAPACVEMFHA